jgi:hypothetical protein
MANVTIIVVNRSRSSRQRVDRVDYIWVSTNVWQGKTYTSLSFHVNETTTELERCRKYHENLEVIEVKSYKKAVRVLREKAPLLTREKVLSRLRYNKSVIQTMMRKVNLQEKVLELVS